jgi:hypothetical protein
MPNFTSPDNIQYPVGTDQVAPLAQVFENLATTTQTAVTSVRNSVNNLDNKLDNTEIGDLADVNVSFPTYGQVVSYNPAGNNFINNADVSAIMAFADATARDAAILAPQEGNLVYMKDTADVLAWNGLSWEPVSGGGGFTARTVITATNTSWPVPSLANPIVKVTAVGGGGGGGGIYSNTNPGAGGTTTFNAGGAGTVTAVGGVAGSQIRTGIGGIAGATGRSGLTAGNQGIGATYYNESTLNYIAATTGGGGEIRVAYLNMTGISTVNVTIGSGGSGGAGGGGFASGGAGGRGEVIFEYVAV